VSEWQEIERAVSEEVLSGPIRKFVEAQ
jgi:hypothetical protein